MDANRYKPKGMGATRVIHSKTVKVKIDDTPIMVENGYLEAQLTRHDNLTTESIALALTQNKNRKVYHIQETLIPIYDEALATFITKNRTHDIWALFNNLTTAKEKDTLTDGGIAFVDRMVSTYMADVFYTEYGISLKFTSALLNMISSLPEFLKQMVSKNELTQSEVVELINSIPNMALGRIVTGGNNAPYNMVFDSIYFTEKKTSFELKGSSSNYRKDLISDVLKKAINGLPHCKQRRIYIVTADGMTLRLLGNNPRTDTFGIMREQKYV